jgi:predicted DNA-binding protein (MmcQ/YjbR family)
MNINKNKLDKLCESKIIEIINVKLDEDMIEELLKKDGFYPAYHMNKKYWISIILDNTLSDKEIQKYILLSYNFTIK